MSRQGWRLCAASVAVLAATALVGAGGTAAASTSSVALAGSVAPFTAHAQSLGAVAGSKQLTIQLWLRGNMGAAARYARAVSTPGSARFHRYLSPAQYSAAFAASPAHATAVAAWLRSQGFSAVHADARRTYVRATGSVSAINAAFQTRVELYRSSAAANAGRYPLRANATKLHIPSGLAPDVLGVTGLDNAAPLSTLDRVTRMPAGSPAPAAGHGHTIGPCSQYYGQHQTGGLPVHFGVTTFPTEVCGYSAGQIRSAYGANFRNTGAGQTVALVELGLTPNMFLTLQDYAKKNGMPAPSANRYAELSLGQGSACGDPFDVEEQLDVESSFDMAPAASQLVVGGDSCNFGDFGLQGLFNADEAVLGGNGTGHPLASVVSNSWESGPEIQPADLTNIEHAFLVQAADEGVGEYFSSGDFSGVEAPSSDPFAIAVGGTTLGIGSTGNRLFETGWSTAVSGLFSNQWFLFGEQGAAGGGPSLIWRQPAFQSGIVPNSLATAPGNRGGRVRSAPDIGADADPFTGFAVGLIGFRHHHQVFFETDIGGTSLAAPIVAGMVASAQQGQPAPFGYLDPVLYTLANTAAVNQAPRLTKASPPLFRGTVCGSRVCGLQVLTTFDDESTDMFGYTGQITRKGYGNMAGIGTPNGQTFIHALRHSG